MRYFILLFLTIYPELYGQENFKENFTGKTLRMDYVLAGNSEQTYAYFSRAIMGDEWTGSRKNIKEPYVNGNYYFEIYDKKSDELLFSKPFNTLFGEWQTTLEAKNVNKAFQQSAFFPCPADSFEFKLNKRNDRKESQVLLQVVLDPKDILLNTDSSYEDYLTIEENAASSKAVDILFIPEGYTLTEKEKFLNDVDRFRNYLFSVEPYDVHRNKFNIHAALSFSEESGTDDPGESNWVDTRMETSFYTFGSARYLTTSEYWKISDLIMNIPFDQIVILVNTDKYGGGGIYNHYSIFSSDHDLSEIVFIHEFGHGFAGLGDEYYDSEVAYESFYDLDSEPLPPNLTTLIDFRSKWKDMVEENTPVPTPPTSEYKDKVGAFEGGGYVSKGVYRPQLDCRMKSNSAHGFCKVCQETIIDIIKYYSE